MCRLGLVLLLATFVVNAQPTADSGPQPASSDQRTAPSDVRLVSTAHRDPSPPSPLPPQGDTILVPRTATSDQRPAIKLTRTEAFDPPQIAPDTRGRAQVCP